MKSTLHSSIFLFAAALIAAGTLARAHDYDARAKALISKWWLTATNFRTGIPPGTHGPSCRALTG